MKLKHLYDKQEDIPEAFRELYTERNGKWELTGIEGIKTQEDVTRLETALTKERADHKATKDKLSPFKDMNAEEVLAKLDRMEELEAAAGGKVDEAKLDEIVEKRLKARVAPLDRKIADLTTKLTEVEASKTAAEGKLTKRSIADEVRSAALKAKIVDTALDDVLLLADTMFTMREDGKIVVRDDAPFSPGLDANTWVNDLKEKRPHWWPASKGAGSGGGNSIDGGGTNPWSAKGWNMTAQGTILREKGEEHAKRLAESVGSSVGAIRPPVDKA
jgi:hypothetical protein